MMGSRPIPKYLESRHSPRKILWSFCEHSAVASFSEQLVNSMPARWKSSWITPPVSSMSFYTEFKKFEAKETKPFGKGTEDLAFPSGKLDAAIILHLNYPSDDHFLYITRLSI